MKKKWDNEPEAGSLIKCHYNGSILILYYTLHKTIAEPHGLVEYNDRGYKYRQIKGGYWEYANI